MSFAIAMFIRPFVYLAVAVLICLPARLAVQRWMPDGKWKRLLLRPIGGKSASKQRGLSRQP